MSKIIVELNVPAANVRDDFAIPYEKPLFESIELMKALFQDNVLFAPDESTVVCDARTGNLFNTNLTPEELELKNGDGLMFF